MKIKTTKILSITTLLALLLIFTPITSYAQIIKSINIYGLNAISRGSVLSYLPVEVGDEYDNYTSEEIIKSLHETNFFKDFSVSYNNNEQTLNIDIVENPHIKEFEVLNYSNDVIEEKLLSEILKNMGLSKGKIFNEQQLEILIEELNKTYISKGYYNTVINKKIEVDSNNRVSVTIDIKEGKPALVKSMKIIGAKVKTEQDLLSLFTIGKADFFIVNYFTKKDKYSQDAVDAGIEEMKSMYANIGYIDFTIDKIDTKFSDNKQDINIEIHINEGKQYKIGKINFSGDYLNQPREKLKSLINISSGDIFARDKIISGIQAITNFFANKGYAYVTTEPETIKVADKNIIDLDIYIDTNKKIYVNRIIISGNTRTHDDVIRREIEIVEGGLYSEKQLNDSIANLQKLGFFSNVQMRISKLKQFKDKIDVYFNVKETKTGKFSIGLAHSNNIGSSFNLGIAENNFLGTGNTLNANLVRSKAVQEASIYFLNPHFNKDKHSISYGIFMRNTDGAELDVGSYKISKKGASFGYGIPITKTMRITANVVASTRNIKCGTTFEKEQPQCAEKNKTALVTGITLNDNTLNAFYYPTAGRSNSATLKVATPLADFKYYKIETNHRSYYNINKDLTLKLRASLDLADGYGDSKLPFFERYYGGGSSSVRGFNFNTLGPKYNDGKAKGGKISLLAGVSIISPLTFVQNSENMRISAFIDAGSISDKISNLGSNEIRLSAGFAFSWVTPIGPLGFYIAKPINKRSGDKTKTTGFTIGTTF